MKTLVSAVALLAFVAGSALPVQSNAQTAGTGQTMAPDTSTSTAPTTTPKRRHHSSKSSHAKKKSKKSTTSQTSSARQKHTRHSVS
jgi:Ni/Co efflux regulator RcnB